MSYVGVPVDYVLEKAAHWLAERDACVQEVKNGEVDKAYQRRLFWCDLLPFLSLPDRERIQTRLALRAYSKYSLIDLFKAADKSRVEALLRMAAATDEATVHLSTEDMMILWGD